MKKLLLFILAAILVTSCIKKFRVTNDLRPLPAANKEIGVNYFNSIGVAGNVDVYYVQGTRNFVKFEGPESALKNYGIEVRGEKLHIAPKDNSLIFSDDDQDVKIYVSSTDLVEVGLAGSGEFYANNHVDTDHMRLKIAGSGDIFMNDLICDDVDCDIAGSGDIKLGQVVTGTAKLTIAGSGDMDVNLQKCGSVVVKIAGSGDVKLRGRTDHSDWKVAGSGTVDTSELITK